MIIAEGLGRGGGGGHGGGGGGRGGGGFHHRGGGGGTVIIDRGGWWPGYVEPELIAVPVGVPVIEEPCAPGEAGDACRLNRALRVRGLR